MAFVSSLSSTRIVYIMEFEIDGEVLHKIGITDRKVEDRFMDILKSYHSVYRNIPKCRLLRFKTNKHNNVIEKILHRMFSDYNVEFDKKFNGYTEFFLLGDKIEELLEVYDDIITKKISLDKRPILPDWAYNEKDREYSDGEYLIASDKITSTIAKVE